MGCSSSKKAARSEAGSDRSQEGGRLQQCDRSQKDVLSHQSGGSRDSGTSASARQGSIPCSSPATSGISPAQAGAVPAGLPRIRTRSPQYPARPSPGVPSTHGTTDSRHSLAEEELSLYADVPGTSAADFVQPLRGPSYPGESPPSVSQGASSRRVQEKRLRERGAGGSPRSHAAEASPSQERYSTPPQLVAGTSGGGQRAIRERRSSRRSQQQEGAATSQQVEKDSVGSEVMPIRASDPLARKSNSPPRSLGASPLQPGRDVLPSYLLTDRTHAFPPSGPRKSASRHEGTQESSSTSHARSPDDPVKALEFSSGSASSSTSSSRARELKAAWKYLPSDWAALPQRTQQEGPRAQRGAARARGTLARGSLPARESPPSPESFHSAGSLGAPGASFVRGTSSSRGSSASGSPSSSRPGSRPTPAPRNDSPPAGGVDQPRYTQGMLDRGYPSSSQSERAFSKSSQR